MKTRWWILCLLLVAIGLGATPTINRPSVLADSATGSDAYGYDPPSAATTASAFLGHNNYIAGRSELTAGPRRLVQRAGSGTPVGSVPRLAGL